MSKLIHDVLSVGTPKINKTCEKLPAVSNAPDLQCSSGVFNSGPPRSQVLLEITYVTPRDLHGTTTLW